MKTTPSKLAALAQELEAALDSIRKAHQDLVRGDITGEYAEKIVANVKTEIYICEKEQ